MDKTSFVMICPFDCVIVGDSEGVDSVQGLEMMEVRQKVFRGGHGTVGDVDPSSVLEEATFASVRQDAKFMVARPPVESLFLLWGENVLASQAYCLVNEASGRNKHCFAHQRTCCEGLKIVVEHIHDVVDEFLG